MTRIVLVRHGQSTWNLEHRIQGQTMDVPLTRRGHRQASEAGRRVAELVPRHTLLLSSDQTRAMQTAQRVGREIASTPKPDARLREQYLGDMEGKLSSELHEMPVPEGADIAEIGWGGGESLLDVWRRCRDLLDELARNPPEALVMVSHGDTLRVMLSALSGGTHRDCDYSLSLTNGIVITRDVDLTSLVASLPRH
ncbi:histidine phosphatase family protein [Cutibacterium equinum]|uniref:Histidine phosphatase family protein n=1 Tax=Cutibacterium equinum TaxID=3016342 RepID=A0ABY7R026_9ACTN|nr:histidine phosphatase family protein [Cutibacterium equinum]WCC80310.1 histidine phosphatase family protein [Cutibacterium equinum]